MTYNKNQISYTTGYEVAGINRHTNMKSVGLDVYFVSTKLMDFLLHDVVGVGDMLSVLKDLLGGVILPKKCVRLCVCVLRYALHRARTDDLGLIRATRCQLR
jgi:hypothetical protein